MRAFTPLEIIQNKLQKIRKKRFLTGFTLIELIIYAGIVCVVLVTASLFAWQIIQGNIKIGAYREIEQNANFAMEKITFAIKNASKIVEPDRPGVETDYLFLRMQDPAKTLTSFKIFDGKIKMTEGGRGPYFLTTDLVKVTNLKFTNLSYGDAPGTVRIEMTLEYLNPMGRSEYQAKVHLENSVSLRY